MEIINSISDIFIKFGWPGLIVIGIISGVLIVLNYFLFKKSDKQTNSHINKAFNDIVSKITEQNSKLFEAMIEQNKSNNEALSAILLKALETNSKNNVEKHNKCIQTRLDISKIVNNKVRDLLNKYNADRAFIVELHNNKQNLSGLSFVWFDMLYEVVAKGIPPIHHLYKDQDASMILPLIEEINSNNGYKIFTLEDLESLQKTSSVLYRRLRIERQLDEAIIVGLYDTNNILIGMLILEYEQSFIPHEVLDIDDILGQAAAISTLIDFKEENE